MSDDTKKCYICLKTSPTKFYDIQNLDADKVSYWDKLQILMATDLIEIANMKICLICARQVQISYKFRQTVLVSQQLHNVQTIDTAGYSDCMKEEIKYESKDIELPDPLREISENELEPQQDDLKLESSCSEYSRKSDEYTTSEDEIDDCTDEKPARKYVRKPKPDLNLQCDHCSARFNKNWKLRKHMTRVHSQSRKYICSYCQKEFKQSFHLKEHMTSHTGEKKYSCSICDRRFQRLSSQRRHVKTHERAPGSKTKRTPFLCTICGKSFPFSNGVQRHMRIHLGIRNFQCDLCNRRFSQSTHLHVHMRTHTGEKPYICDTCGEKFALKAALLKHMRTWHCDKGQEVPIYYIKKELVQT